MNRKALALVLMLLTFAGCGEQPSSGPAGPELVVTDANFQEAVLKSNKPVLVDFYADWCGPCREMAPTVAQVAVEFEGRAIVGKVNVDQNKAIPAQYGINGIPTFLLFKNGKLASKVVGPTSKSDLAARLNALIDK